MLRLGFPALALILCALGAAPGRAADPAAELAKFSAFPQLDLSKLAGGKVLTARGPNLDFPRDLSIQAVYVVSAPLAKTVDLHRQWDPSRHSQLKVIQHGDISAKPAPTDFSKIASAPSNGPVKALAASTQKLPAKTSLQLSSAEAQEFKGGPWGAFWSSVLLKRVQGFASGGFASQPPYDFGKESTRSLDEANRLLKAQPKLRAQFRDLIAQTPLGGGTGSLPPQFYWELFDMDGEGSFSLGATYAKEGADSSTMLDMQYYASGGYFVYVTLYQMWPSTLENKPATLVWRGDSLASLALSELRGVERMGSGAAMMKEVQRSIDFFQQDSRK